MLKHAFTPIVITKLFITFTLNLKQTKMNKKTEVLKAEIQEAEIITNEIQVHVNKINGLPVIVDEIAAMEIELGQLIEEGKDLKIDGVGDKKGAKALNEHRLKIRRLRLNIQDKYEPFKSTTNKLHKFVVGKEKESTAIASKEEKAIDEEYKDWEQLVRDEAIKQKEEEKKNFEERVKAVQATGAKLEGLTFSLCHNESSISVTMYELREISEDYFNNEFLRPFTAIKDMIIEKELEDKKIISHRRELIEPYKNYLASWSDDELLNLTDNQIKKEIESAKEYKQTEEKRVELDRIIQYRKSEYHKYIDTFPSVSLEDIEEMSCEEFEKELQEAKTIRAERDQEIAAEKKRLADQKAAQDKKQKELELKEQKQKEEAEKLERERKEKLRLEEAKKAAIEAEKQKQAQQKADKERQCRLKNDKQRFYSELGRLELGIDNSFLITLDQKEVIELGQQFESDLNDLIESYKQKIENL